MDCLQAKLGSRELDGIRITNNLTICHRLFADDVGVFIPATEQSFKKLQMIIKLYETTLSTKGLRCSVSTTVYEPDWTRWAPALLDLVLN